MRQSPRVARLLMACATLSWVVLSARAVPPAISELTAALRSADYAERLSATRSLSARGAEARSSFGDLIQLLTDDEEIDCALASTIIYSQPRSADETPRLIEALEFPTKARTAAAWRLSQIGLPAGSAAGALRGACALPDKHERNFAIVAFACVSVPSNAAVADLLVALRDHGDARTAQHNYTYPRAAAALALGMMGPHARPAIKDLAAIAVDAQEWEVQRAAACFALGRVGHDHDSFEALSRAAKDRSPLVRKHAQLAITRVSTHDLREDVASLTRLLENVASRVDPAIVAGLQELAQFSVAPVAPSSVIRRTRREPRPIAVHESISLAISYMDSLQNAPSPDAIRSQGDTLDGPARTYIMALGGVQQSITQTLLERVAQTDQNACVAAIRRLAAMGAQARASAPALRRLLVSADWIVRREAALAIVAIEPASDEGH